MLLSEVEQRLVVFLQVLKNFFLLVQRRLEHLALVLEHLLGELAGINFVFLRLQLKVEIGYFLIPHPTLVS